MPFDLITLVFAAVCNLTLSGFVFLRNTSSRVNQVFGIFGLSIILWTSCNFAADHVPTYSLVLTRLTLLFGTAIFTSLFMLCTLFPSPKASRRSWTTFYAASFVIMLICLTPLFVASVQSTAHGAELAIGPLYVLYVIYMPLAVIWSMRLLLRGVRGRSQAERSQTKLFAAGIIVGTTLAFLTNLILPVLVNSWAISRFGPIFTIPFVAITAYAIVRHRLFDIRWALTRTLGFVLTIGVVSVVYSLLVLGIGAPVVTNGQITLFRHQQQLLLLLPPTIIVGLTFHGLQRAIARLTRRVFYQDLYDTRQVLDLLSDALISESSLATIMTNGMTVLANAVKPKHAVLVVLDNKHNIYKHHALHGPVPVTLRSLVRQSLMSKVSIYNKDDTRAEHWPAEFEQEDIALIVRLGTSSRTTGLLLFGPKQNGRIYSRRDMELLGVSAKNFGIAIENAKKYEQIATFAETMKAEVERATASLRRANNTLKTLDAMKDDFISMASHQLRSPAASIHDAIQMLSHGYIKPEQRAKIIELADASSERLVNVVTDMLSVARIQAGHFTLEKTKVDMGELVERTVPQISALADEKAITVRVEKPIQPLYVMGDRAKLIEIMSNYLENALAYGHERSEVVVKLAQDARRVSFEVQDQGIGVPKNERRQLFDRFYRASNARKEQPNGNGIGLFVVKTVAKSHGGGVYYRPLTDGSVFGFWLKSE